MEDKRSYALIKIPTNPAKARITNILLDKSQQVIQFAPTTKWRLTMLSIHSGFDADMRKENWKLLEDTGNPSEFDVRRLELVWFPAAARARVGWKMIFKQVCGKEVPNHNKVVGCNWSQRHGEELLRNQHLIPIEARGNVIILPGTVWQDSVGRRVVACLVFHSNKKWVLGFRLADSLSGYSLHLRKWPLIV